MLSKQTQQLLAKYFDLYIKLENEVECRREELAQNLFFEPYTAFTRLDYKQIQYFNIHDLKQLFEINHLQESEEDLHLIIRKMDTDKDQYISFSEFTRYILPHNDQTLNSLANNRVSYKLEQKLLPYQVEKLICRVFQAELHLSHSLKQLTQELKSQQDWNKISAWESVNRGRNWDVLSLYEFLENFQILQVKKNIENFIYRNSKEKDYRINYSDFLYLIYTLDEQTPYQTPIKKSQKITNNSTLQQTNYRTDDSTNIKSDKINRHSQSQSYHETMQFQRDVEVSEFQVEDNEIDILMFILTKQRLQKDMKLQSLTQLFNKIDIAQKNYITLEDLMNYFSHELHKQIRIEDLIRLVKILDKNKDGIVTPLEFRNSILEHVLIKQK